MENLLFILLLSGVVHGQFQLRRFVDSFEDDSRENFFGRRTSLNRGNLFDDSDEVFFPGGTRTPIRNSLQGFSGGRQRSFFDDSAEDFFRRTRKRLDDSDEIFFGSNRNGFASNPNLNRNTNFRLNGFGSNRNAFNSRFRKDSIEDVFEDLFDDDLDDRLRAQNTLARLQNNGGNFFRNSGVPQNQGITSFQTRVGNNRFSAPSTRTINRPLQPQFNDNTRTLNHFSVSQHSNRVPSNHFSLGSNRGNNDARLGNRKNRFANSNFGIPLGTDLTNQRSSTKNTFNRNPSVNIKSASGSSLSSFSSSPLSASKRSSFSSSPGFNWPGGNGYYVSMSTGNSKPVTYFVKYDD